MPMTLVFEGDEDALKEAYRRITAFYPFSVDGPDRIHPVVISGANAVGDALSVLDCIEAVTRDSDLRHGEGIELIEKLTQLNTFAQCADKLEEWEVEVPGRDYGPDPDALPGLTATEFVKGPKVLEAGDNVIAVSCELEPYEGRTPENFSVHAKVLSVQTDAHDPKYPKGFPYEVQLDGREIVFCTRDELEVY